MKKSYDKKIILRCVTCGDSNFEFNEEKTWAKCVRCGREYNNGHDELIELNQSSINSSINETKSEIIKDMKNDLSKMLKDAFKGNKNIKFK